MRFKLFALYLAMGLVMVQYQNCAPTPGGQAYGESFAEAETPVDVIDQVNVGQISFAQNKVSAFLDESVVIRGVCDQSGSLIAWTLRDSGGEVIERGMSPCDLGSFEVELSDQWQGHCDQDLQLKAALGAKASSETTVEAFCE